jgi:hypothetical protein
MGRSHRNREYCEQLLITTSRGITVYISATRQLPGCVCSSHLSLYLSLQSLYLGRCRGVTRTFVSPTIRQHKSLLLLLKSNTEDQIVLITLDCSFSWYFRIVLLLYDRLQALSRLGYLQ